MKITGIGDIHGRDIWKEIVNKEKDSDKIVFIGDYLDTHENIGSEKQANNFLDILEYKRKNSDQVVLLIGNHDYHYLPKCIKWGVQFSGYSRKLSTMVSYDVHEAVKEGLIQAVFVYENNIFVHAGLSKTWCDNHHVDFDNLEEYVNNYFLYNTGAFNFQPHPKNRLEDPYGDDVFQSPLWIRPRSLIKDRLEDYNQIVGHTQAEEIELSMPIKLIDTLGTSGEYLIINDGVFKAETL